MLRASTFKFLATFSLLLCSAVAVSSATLQAKVVEVRAGNILIVSNINRAVTVRLKAIAPPEVGQPFNDVAREHLKALVLEKSVIVEYTHFAENYLEARVLSNGIDIGSQMLRDGVVWYDHAFDYELNQADRDLYSQCEAAARSEKRGLWQDASPLAPWEYRRIQQEKLAQRTNPVPLRVSSQLRKPKASGLSNDEVMKLVMGSGSSPLGMSGLKPISQNGSPNRWVKYSSATGHFSVTLPSNAVEGSDVIPDPSSGGSVAINFVTGGSNLGFYVALSAKGPNDSYDDATIRDQFISSLIAGMNHGAAQDGHPMVTLKPDHAISLSGYSGMQYRLSSSDMVGAARVLTKQVGDDREIYVLFAMSKPGSEDLGNQFLKSFAIQR